MERIAIAVLRGVCQLPAYVAKETGLFDAEGIEARLEVLPTAWVVPERLLRGEFQFAVMPWTRVATAASRGEDLVLVCGSGYEEAAIVVRKGMDLADVRTLAVPQEGGIKDLTAQALMQSLAWDDRQKLRLPSGDGAILALVGQGADAASMVEPYASMMEALGIGTIVKSTGDLWPGAPGCSLATTRRLIEERPDLVRRTVAAFAAGAEATTQRPDAAARIGASYIGVHADFIRRALARNQPRIDALNEEQPQEQILQLMQQLGYMDERPSDYLELGFLRDAMCVAASA
jgi:ABC-type nitrate/sulfonate/bicarbonate transport system substrate-binding protein